MSDVSAIIIHIGKFSLQINNLFLYGLEFVFSLRFSSTLRGRKLKNKILQKLVKGLCIFVRRSTT